jgi:predicted small secreted protein
MRKLFILFAAAAVMGTSACNTIAGAGHDVSSAGNAVTDTAHDATPH